MTLRQWIAEAQARVDSEIFTITESVRREEQLEEPVIVGGFSPFYEDDDEPTPIMIEIVVSEDTDLIEDEYGEFGSLTAELEIVMNHESIHYEQYQAGKFIYDEYDQLINREELEEEAYRLEEGGYIL